ncbi:TrbC/VirB2 family protein [Pseudomonas sp. CGJS7]|uniref:TrbC/VirB2 family protein n=1 Tax=Pseudomonas sp. CGJS7 TaxID=3109348 RepID=UPI0030090617
MNSNIYFKNFLSAFAMAATFVVLLMLPEVGFAQTDAKARVTSFFGNLNSLLNIASVAIVTIAVIFAGYQVAFAHKRITEVASILIGGFMIGAATQVAKMLIPQDAKLGEEGVKMGMYVVNSLMNYA